MPKRFLVFDLATGTVDAAVSAAVEAAIAASVTSNTIKITVADQAGRYALTEPQAQNGDYVFQADTATLYEVIDQTLLHSAEGYVALATVTAAQISDASASGRALLTGNVAIGSGSHAVTLETVGDTLLQLPASGRLGTSSVLLTNHQALYGTTLVTGVKYGLRQEGYNGAYAYLPTGATAGDVIELEDVEGRWGQHSFTLYATEQYLNGNWYGSLVCAAPFSRVRAIYLGNGYWSVLVDDPGKFTEIYWDGNSSLYPLAGNRWSMTYPTSYSIYLPSGASEGDEIHIRDRGSNWGSYGIWLYGNNTYLNGSWWGSFYASTTGATIRCVYEYDSSIGQLGWKVAVVGSTTQPVWAEDSSSTNYCYPQAAQRLVFSYPSPGDALYAYLPSSPARGDEIWIADGGRNWSVYPLVISANAPINGNWSGFTISRQWALARCVYLGGSVGWSITESGVSRDAAWQTAAGGSLYPSPGDRLNFIHPSTAYVYLPGSASEGDEILLRDAGNQWASYGIYVYATNTYLNGGWANSFYSTASGATIRCVYGYDSSNSTWGWIVGVGSTERWGKVSDSAQRVFSGCKYFYAPASGGQYVNLPYGSWWQRKPGDEILLADPGQTWGAFPFYIQIPNGYGGGDMINGAAVPFYADRPGGQIRCVYIDDTTGWTVGYADEGQWGTGIDSSFTLYPNGRYSCAFSAPQTLTLPSPDYQNLKPGDEILIEDAGTPGTNGWGTHTLTLDCANQTINGVAGDKTITTDGAAVRCVWVGGSTGWSVKTLPGTVL